MNTALDGWLFEIVKLDQMVVFNRWNLSSYHTIAHCCKLFLDFLFMFVNKLQLGKNRSKIVLSSAIFKLEI